MTDQRGGRDKRSWIEHGPVWITAITGAVVAFGTFFVGKATTPGDTSVAPAQTVVSTVTETVTVPGEPGGPREIGASESTAQKNEPGVRFSGELAFGKLNLDFNPPRPFADDSIQALAADDLYNSGKHALAEWQQADTLPDKAECSAYAAAEGDNETAGLVEGSIICGTTPEGRVFRLKVLGVGNSIRVDATVWEK